MTSSSPSASAPRNARRELGDRPRELVVTALRSAYIDAGGVARSVLALPQVGDRWNEPSALREMTVGALSAHLVRAVTNVDGFLESPPPAVSDQKPVTAAEYFSPVTGDLTSALNARVRTGAEEEAMVGQRALLGRLDRALERLRTRLPAESDDRLVLARDTIIRLDEHLRTRLIELATHIDDLCVSVDAATPALPGIDVAIDTLVEVAKLRHGELAVLRALSRRERDHAGVLRVI